VNEKHGNSQCRRGTQLILSHLPPAEGLCGKLLDIHPVCALGRRQTNA
jgi:hypothetical protein